MKSGELYLTKDDKRNKKENGKIKKRSEKIKIGETFCDESVKKQQKTFVTLHVCTHISRHLFIKTV